MKKSLIIIFLVIFQVSYGQNLNSYKYVIVPMEYDFLKEPNQYQLAELTKFLFEKEGFKTYLEGEVPENVPRNSCEALYADLEEDSGLFVTRLRISLKDCNNREIFKSNEGKSREKDFQRGHQEALRNAFESIAALDYNYVPAENVVEVTAIPRQEEKNVKGEVKQSIPEVQKQEEISAEKAKTSGTASAEKELTFSRDNAVYHLQKTSSGYNFYQKGMAEPFAALVKSSTGDTYIYSSVTSKGVASFNKQGDLIVEILDSGSGELKSTHYVKQSQ